MGTYQEEKGYKFMQAVNKNSKWLEKLPNDYPLSDFHFNEFYSHKLFLPILSIILIWYSALSLRSLFLRSLTRSKRS